jgi:hypothetical protein
MKQKPVVIRTPYPTTEELAEEFGVSKKRLRELRKLVGFEPVGNKTRPARHPKKRAGSSPKP